MFQSPGDIAFYIGSMPVYYYGLILAIAAFTGFYAAYKLYAEFFNPDEAEKILDMAPILILAGIFGARLYYCIVNYSYYIIHPLEVFNIRQGGLSIHGMILGGIIALYFCVKHYKIDFLRTLDVMACGTSLAQAIGRWGNFFNSEAFGMPTNLPWKLYIPIAHRPQEFIRHEYFHPTFLYESILDLAIFTILYLILRRHKIQKGILFGIYLLLYSFVRIGVEYLRVDSILYISGIPVAQWVSIWIIIIALFYLGFLLRNTESSN